MLPGLAVPGDGVKHGKEFAHTRGEGDLTGFTGVAETTVEGLDGGVAPGGDYGGHVECGAYCRTATPDAATTPPLAAVSVEGRQSGQGRDFLVVELSQFGQPCDEGSGDHWTNTGHRLQELGLLAPGWVVADQCGDAGVGLPDLFIKPVMVQDLLAAKRDFTLPRQLRSWTTSTSCSWTTWASCPRACPVLDTGATSNPRSSSP